MKIKNKDVQPRDHGKFLQLIIHMVCENDITLYHCNNNKKKIEKTNHLSSRNLSPEKKERIYFIKEFSMSHTILTVFHRKKLENFQQKK